MIVYPLSIQKARQIRELLTSKIQSDLADPPKKKKDMSTMILRNMSISCLSMRNSFFIGALYLK